jgi:U3 small nucleolar RNA-associated protein 19
MLALNGIFVLVTQHGLEYPQFYERLYQMTTADAFAAKHRAQFFKLADLFLASGLVPAYTAAAFAKKMARLALSAPPAGAMTAIAFIHNLIRRHPSCMVLLDCVPPANAASSAAGDDDDSGGGAADAQQAGLDVFDEHEPDPSKCRAVESSLWEVQRLRNHYCPQVATLCTVLDKDLTDRPRTNEVDIDPILSTSYTSLFNAELARRLKQVPLAFYQRQPTKLFDDNCDADFGGWDFGGDAEQ